MIINRGDFKEIYVGAGMDGLKFTKNHEREASIGVEGWQANAPWHKPFDAPLYQVYEWKDGWAYNRGTHPILGRLNGQANSREDAMTFCAEDFQVVARLRRWQEYMQVNEPPTE